MVRMLKEADRNNSRELMEEKDHGLGLNRKVLACEVRQLDHYIGNAARLAVEMGVSNERFCDLAEAAIDVALSKGEV